MQKCKFLAYACFRGVTFEQKVVNNYLSLSLCKIWPNDQISPIYSNAVNRREVRLANTGSKNNVVPSDYFRIFLLL